MPKRRYRKRNLMKIKLSVNNADGIALPTRDQTLHSEKQKCNLYLKQGEHSYWRWRLQCKLKWLPHAAGAKRRKPKLYASEHSFVSMYFSSSVSAGDTWMCIYCHDFGNMWLHTAYGLDIGFTDHLCTHHSGLQAIAALSLISTLYKSPQHPLSLFQPSVP
jgi:hypothetical protein